MGNCQAVDAAALVIQHPSGRIERLYWPVTASEVMRTNPGHYVSLIIPLPSPTSKEDDEKGELDNKKPLRFTRVKLLRPTETLALGHAYRLVTSQEVMKVSKAKKFAKTKDHRPDDSSEKLTAEGKRAIDNTGGCRKVENSDTGKQKKTNLEEMKHGRHRSRTAPTNSAAGRPRSWRPTLHIIDEVGS